MCKQSAVSPTDQQQLHAYSEHIQPTMHPQQQQQSFRSLSTNPTLLRNINETDDEINMIEAEFDRYSQRSFRTNNNINNNATVGVSGGTVQRSKYHTVSNDFVDVTRPPAPTPVPSSSYMSNRMNNRKFWREFCLLNDNFRMGSIIVYYLFIYYSKKNL